MRRERRRKTQKREEGEGKRLHPLAASTHMTVSTHIMMVFGHNNDARYETCLKKGYGYVTIAVCFMHSETCEEFGNQGSSRKKAGHSRRKKRGKERRRKRISLFVSS